MVLAAFVRLIEGRPPDSPGEAAGDTGKDSSSCEDRSWGWTMETDQISKLETLAAGSNWEHRVWGVCHRHSITVGGGRVASHIRGFRLLGVEPENPVCKISLGDSAVRILNGWRCSVNSGLSVRSQGSTSSRRHGSRKPDLNTCSRSIACSLCGGPAPRWRPCQPSPRGDRESKDHSRVIVRS